MSARCNTDCKVNDREETTEKRRNMFVFKQRNDNTKYLTSAYEIRAGGRHLVRHLTS